MRGRPQKTPDDHNRQQRHYFETTGQRTLKPTGSPYLRCHAAKMMEFAGIRPGDRVLEVGCGMGRYTVLLQESGVRIEALDLSPELLKQIELAKGDQIPLHCCDVGQCPPSMHGQYDVVLGFFVLHHVHDVTSTIEACRRLVKPGGTVAFLEPNPFNPLYYFQIMFSPGMRWASERGMLRMRREILRESVTSAGLDEFVFDRFGFLPPFVINRPGGIQLESVLEAVPIWRQALPFQLFKGTRV